MTVIDRGSHETRNGIAWAAEVHVIGQRWRVENDGNGGADRWSLANGKPAGTIEFDTVMAELARLARTEPALAEAKRWMRGDRDAASLYVTAALDGAFLVMEAG